MKGKIYLYLFVFALMFAIFQYVNTKRYSEKKEAEIEGLQKKVDSFNAEEKTFQAKLDSLNDQNRELEGFSLKTNSKARGFFEDQGKNPDSIAAKIESAIISKNKADADNALVPYAGIAGIMRVNRIKVLNNRWVIAEFSDGTYWGEALISYYFDENDQLQFHTDDGVIYAK